MYKSYNIKVCLTINVLDIKLTVPIKDAGAPGVSSLDRFGRSGGWGPLGRLRRNVTDAHTQRCSTRCVRVFGDDDPEGGCSEALDGRTTL